MNQSMNAAQATAADKIDRISVKNIVDTAIAAGQFTTFLAVINAATMRDAFAAKGPFTVFAPTDEAFRKLPAGSLDALLKNSGKLKSLLNYHTISGAVLASDVKVGEVMTLHGTTATFNVASEIVHVNDARITQRNIIAANGIIHAIDAVLVPRDWRPLSAGTNS